MGLFVLIMTGWASYDPRKTTRGRTGTPETGKKRARQTASLIEQGRQLKEKQFKMNARRSDGIAP
jgi:hypothetical protein